MAVRLGAMMSAEPETGPYAPIEGFYDEALTPDGSLRVGGGEGVAALEAHAPGELAEALGAHLEEHGVGFRSVSGETTFTIDPVPRVLGAAEWADLEAGLIQRVRALNRFLADAYGPREAVSAGAIPARVIETAEGLEPQMHGVRPPGDLWAGIAGLDLVRDAAGELLVLEDNLTTPSGFAYAVAAREVVLSRLDPPDAVRPRPLAPLLEMLGATLRSAAPEATDDPYVVVLTDGPDNSAAWEHAWAARKLGMPLVEPQELTPRGDRLLHEGRPVDVVYRRTDADRVETEVGALLLGPLRAGTLGVVNAFGTGVADDKLAHAYVEAMVRFYLGEAPLLRSVETLDLAVPEQLERALDEFETLVVKPRGGSGGVGVVICAHASPEDLEATRRAVREAPEAYVAQPLVRISLHPTVIDGALRPRHVDLRPFIFLRASGEADVMPGGLTRVAFGEGAMVVNSTQNGGAKDTWVLP
jgi:carboxylate-amine ligase